MQFNDFHCQACNLYFSTDLDESEVSLCPFCGHRRPERIKIIEPKSVLLCAECRDRSAKKRDEELEADLDDAFRLAGL
jgi:hypothetical protein